MTLKIPKEQKQQIIDRVQQYFRDERDEEISELAADLLLDFITKQIRPWIYNQAVDDAQALVSQRMAAIEEDLYALKIPLREFNSKEK